eukprot:CAMPEP_0194499312 /NCGR_PEP_ID=MMETSP0253-20130528/15655_1 /TAXON_ID=2966 /ORGANISM="Noctiluca scintillans" /LENGTH=87 /DNA_ID=CAMNT_0039341049 /DNA_START=118 /DNA_END=381 /DNA_ORIENTATION=-
MTPTTEARKIGSSSRILQAPMLANEHDSGGSSTVSGWPAMPAALLGVVRSASGSEKARGYPACRKPTEDSSGLIASLGGKLSSGCSW